MDTIYNLIKKEETRLLYNQPVKLGKYATYDQAELVATIEAYLNSQYTSGKTDSKNREKPFFNIVNQAVNVWYKATDIDRKDIQFRPTKASQRLKAFIATIKFRRWMRENNFGLWLNNLGYAMASYGSAVSKFVEKNGKLIASVIPWSRIICDPVDFDSAPVIEKIYYTPAQLRESAYDPDAVQQVIDTYEGRQKDIRTTLSNENKDLADEYIGVYELHGNLPLYYLTGKEKDKKVYQQQMHAVFITESNATDKRGKPTGITLYKGKEEKNPYFVFHLIKQDGRAMSIGAVEYLLDAQWMVNHSMKNAKDQLDLSSKNLVQTSDAQFTGRNVTTDLDVGDILVTDDNKPLLPVNIQPTAVPFLMNYMKQWYEVGKDITGATDAMQGNTMPAGTPYRLGAMLNIESHNLFEIMRESKGLYLEQAIREYILPFFKKQLKNSDEVVLDLEGEEIEQFDKLALPVNLAMELKERLSDGEIPSPDELLQSIQEKNSLMGKKRAINLGKSNMTWKDYFSDLDMDAIEIEITGENRNKAEAFSLMNGLLQLMIQNPNALQNPNVQKLINRIMDEAGYIEPFQLSPLPSQPTQGITPPIGGAGSPQGGQFAGINPVQGSQVPGVGVLPKSRGNNLM